MSTDNPALEDMTDEQREAALQRHRASIKGPLIPDDDPDVMQIEEVVERLEAGWKKD